MTRTQLEKLVAQWQHRLRLDDWNIEVVAIAAEAVAYADSTLGHCYAQTSSHDTKIVIALDSDDPENTVVHELLHIVLHETSCAHGRAAECLGGDGREISKSHYHCAEDIAIRSLADTLLALHRKEV